MTESYICLSCFRLVPEVWIEGDEEDMEAQADFLRRARHRPDEQPRPSSRTRSLGWGRHRAALLRFHPHIRQTPAETQLAMLTDFPVGADSRHPSVLEAQASQAASEVVLGPPPPAFSFNFKGIL